MNKVSGALAPIALFACRGPDHLTRTLNALLANPEASRTELFVFYDAAKDAFARREVNEVRDFMHGCAGFAAVHVVCREVDYGLARNITEGITEVLKLR